MNRANEPTTGKVVAAFAIAICADCIQLPINVLTLTGVLAVPSEAVDLVVDMGAFCVTSALLGFHWALLPTAFLEAVPFLDAFPTWTGCVAFVIYQRKQEFARQSRAPGVLEAVPGSSSPASGAVRGDEHWPVRQVSAVAVHTSREG